MERAKQIQAEHDNPHAIWDRNREERPDEYAVILQRRAENLDDLAWLETYTTLLKAGKEPDVEDVLNVAASALLNIAEFGYEDHLHCPPEWAQEFTFARESALHTSKNVEWYEFGVAGLRVPRDLWQTFVEHTGAYIKRVMPNYEGDETARLVMAAMRPPAPTYNRGAMRECPSCRVLANSAWVSDAIWNEYVEKGIRYQCHGCREAERKSVAQAVLSEKVSVNRDWSLGRKHELSGRFGQTRGGANTPAA